jgi:hypothetical protein
LQSFLGINQVFTSFLRVIAGDGIVPGFKPRAVAAEQEGELMREQLNSNPLVQLAVVGVLLIGAAIFVMSSSGGGEEEAEPGTTEATVSVAGTDASGSATGATPGEAVEGAIESATEAAGAGESAGFPSAAVAPPLPDPVLEAWKGDKTLVLLFVRDGGIDDRLVKTATADLAGFRDAAVFIVPAGKISRYAAITEGVGVERVPALVVVAPKHLKKTVPTASLSYGFQNSQSIAQAVIDAGYKGKTLDYHP